MLNIVYLFPKYYHDCKMSRGRVEYGRSVQTLVEMAGGTFTWFGQGWVVNDHLYNGNWSLKENLNAARLAPEVAWFYKGNELKEVTPDVAPKRLVVFNEANHAGKTVEEIEGACANAVVFHHVEDHKGWAKKLDVRDIEHDHIPHAAAGVFARHAKPHAARDIDVLMSGVVSDVYPLRKRYMVLINSGRLEATVREHPGYRFENNSATAMQFVEYAKQLGRAKVALVCSSIYEYGLAKWFEALAAGCVCVGDIPPEIRASEDFHRCVNVAADATDEEILRAVQHAKDLAAHTPNDAMIAITKLRLSGERATFIPNIAASS
jgi:hypothetical protein